MSEKMDLEANQPQVQKPRYCTKKREHNCYFCSCVMICFTTLICIIIFTTMYVTDKNFETTKLVTDLNEIPKIAAECRFLSLDFRRVEQSDDVRPLAFFALNYTDSNGQIVSTVATVCPFEAASPPEEWYTIDYVAMNESCPFRDEKDYIVNSFRRKFGGFGMGDLALCSVDPSNLSNYRFCPIGSSSCVSNAYQYNLSLLAYMVIVVVGLALSLISIWCMRCMFDDIGCL
jgi:hypothetical protein